MTDLLTNADPPENTNLELATITVRLDPDQMAEVNAKIEAAAKQQAGLLEWKLRDHLNELQAAITEWAEADEATNDPYDPDWTAAQLRLGKAEKRLHALARSLKKPETEGAQ